MVDNLILSYYTNGNYFLTRNGDRAPRTIKWQRLIKLQIGFRELQLLTFA